MNKIINVLIIFFIFLSTNLIAMENIMILKLKYCDVKIEMYPDSAPNHVKRIQELANSGQ